MGSDTDTGFARWAFADYRPQTDLLELAKEIALVIEHDCYIVDHSAAYGRNQTRLTRGRW